MSDNSSASQRRTRSRRQVLTGAAGALGAVTAGSLAAASPAQADDGDPVFLGVSNTETNPTAIVNTTQNEIIDHANGLVVTAGEGSVGFGVIGNGGSNGGDGVRGKAGGQTGTGVSGLSQSGFGVQGQSFSGSGVYGNIDDGSDAGEGVHGVGPTGVAGHTHHVGGVGVRAQDDTGNGKALDVDGVASFSRSGFAFVPAGSIQVTVPGVTLTQASMVLALVQLDAPAQGGLAGRVWATSVLTAPSEFTIFVNKTSTMGVRVAWFVLN